MRPADYLTKQQAGIVREKKGVVVEREIDRLVNEHGSITPKLLLDSAKSESSPLHKYFEWDDSIAAEKYRLNQATQMILATRFVVVLEEKRSKPETLAQLEPVRKMLPTFRGEGFAPRDEVLAERETRLAMIEHKKSALRAWCRSVIDIEELSELRKTIEKQLNTKRV